MADQTDFKHITVNPAEPDDVVIHAGAPRDDSQSGQTDASPTSQRSTSPASVVSEPVSAQPSSKEADVYHPTTLDDIQGFKMSKTQIAVIIVALAAIVAAVVWYLVFS